MAQDQIHTYSSTQWVCTLGHSPYFVMFAYPDDWVFSDIFQSCFFTEALAYQMCTLGHTPYQFFLWILDVAE